MNTPSPNSPVPLRRRVWLLGLLLLCCIAWLMSRPDSREDAAHPLSQAGVTLLYDRLGISPRRIYLARLRLAGLDDTALVARWRDAASQAQHRPFAHAARAA